MNMVSNVSEWLVADTLNKYVTLSSVGVEKRSLKVWGGGGGQPTVVVKNFNCHRSPRFAIFLLVLLKIQTLCT